MIGIHYCSQCGQATESRIPEDDNRPRAVCGSCAHIHYQNPIPVCVALLEHQGKILLCRRAIEPFYGLWTLPGGYMEIGESPLEAAKREAREEAQATTEHLALFSLYTFTRVGSLNITYRGELVDGFAQPGPESLETQLFAEADIPWDQLAFSVIRENLKQYFADRAAGRWRLHEGEVVGNAATGWHIEGYQAQALNNSR